MLYTVLQVTVYFCSNRVKKVSHEAKRESVVACSHKTHCGGGVWFFNESMF